MIPSTLEFASKVNMNESNYQLLKVMEGRTNAMGRFFTFVQNFENSSDGFITFVALFQSLEKQTGR